MKDLLWKEWNTCNPGGDQYSILSSVNHMMCNDNQVGGCRYEFKLSWPTLPVDPKEQSWIQSNKPLDPRPVTDYEAVDVPYTGAFWNGLAFGSNTNLGDALVDGSSTTWWWYAVGTHVDHTH